ncbi:restriction endonuclease subunit S [Arthrobacter sp. Sr24]
MSRIDALITELCPDGVEFQPLGELCVVFSGYAFKSKLFNTEGVGLPLIRIRDVNTGVSGTYYSGEFDSRFIVSDGDILIGMDGDFRVTRWSHGKALLNQRVCRLQDFADTLEPKFMYYYVQGELDRIHLGIQASTVKHLSSGDLGNSPIPVPPLQVQREIVRILDQFTQLEAELEAELEARRRQYEHYAGVLLESDEDVPRVRFGDVATIVRGASPRPIQQFIADSADGVPWIKIGDVPARGKYITDTAQRVTPEGAAKSRRVRPGDFVLSNSMSFGRPYISKIDGYIHDGWLAISAFEESFVSDYLYYLLRSTPVQEEFSRRAGAGTVKNLNAAIVRSVEIPLPTKERQKQVVELLDKFDALVNDLSVGLPAELAARRKQYEYYRDCLLTFEEAAA